MKKLIKVLIPIMVMVTIIGTIPVSASADSDLAYGAATVDTEVLRLRSGPGTDHEVLDRLAEGDIIVILERTTSDWYKVNFHGTVGYVSTEFLRDVLTAENFNAQGKITGNRVNMRTRPTTSSGLLGTYPQDTVMIVIGINNGWYKVRYDGKTGYVRSDFMDIIEGHVSAAVSGVSVTKKSLGEQIADFALGFVGYKYVNGGASPSPGFDCSGLTTYAYKTYGITIARTASGQYSNNGKKVKKADLLPGDLVFFSSNGGKSVTHVGIYIGDSEFVHASRTGVGVVISRLDSAYYKRVWFGAKRIV